MYYLHKESWPDVWSKPFGTQYDVVVELKHHICGECLDEIEPVDKKTGVKYACNDLGMLLSSPCGLEYTVTDDTK